MSNLNCPICNLNTLTGENSHPYPSTNIGGNSLKQIFFCSQCGLGVGYPEPSAAALEQLYERSGYWGTDPLPLSFRRQPVLYALAKARWSLISSYIEDKKELSLIDIGAGYGYLGIVSANEPQNKISKYIAIEPDGRLRKTLRDAWLRWGKGTQLETFATLEEYQKTGEAVNIVALSHILEHIQAPLTLIQQVKSFLVDNGLVFIDVPNQDYKFKSDVFPHLLFFSKLSISKLLKNASLNVLHLKTWGISMDNTPLNSKASRSVKICNHIINRFHWLFPKVLLIRLSSKNFGTDVLCENGTWIRAIGIKN